MSKTSVFKDQIWSNSRLGHIDSGGKLKLGIFFKQSIIAYLELNFLPCQAYSILNCVAKNNRKRFVVVCFYQILWLRSVLWSHLEVEICHYSSGAVQMLWKMTNKYHAFSRRLVLQLIVPAAIELTAVSVVADEEHAACQHVTKLTGRTGDF